MTAKEDRHFLVSAVVLFSLVSNTAVAQFVLGEPKIEKEWLTDCIHFEENVNGEFNPKFSNRCKKNSGIGYCVSITYKDGESIDNCSEYKNVNPKRYNPLPSHAYLEPNEFCYLFPYARSTREIEDFEVRFAACHATERTISYVLPYTFTSDISGRLQINVVKHNGRFPISYDCLVLHYDNSSIAPSIGSKIGRCRRSQ